MTIAELHGKISDTGSNLDDKMEDLLTFDVFGPCRYLRPETLLFPFLGTARSNGGAKLGDLLPKSVERVDYYFWPLLAHSEPDLLLVLVEPQARLHPVMIEAKYLSGKSDDALREDDLAAAVAPTDQLAREYGDLFLVEGTIRLDPNVIGSRHLGLRDRTSKHAT